MTVKGQWPRKQTCSDKEKDRREKTWRENKDNKIYDENSTLSQKQELEREEI